MRVKALTAMPTTMPSLTLMPIVAANVASHITMSDKPTRYSLNGSSK